MRASAIFTTTTAALLAMSACPVSAADLTFSDLRLGFGVLSSNFEGESNATITNVGSGISTTQNDSAGRNSDENWRGQLQYVGGNLGAGGGLVWGIGLAVNNAKWDDGAQNSHVTTPTVDVMIGYGYAVTPNWHIELTPFAGYGRAYYSVTHDGSSETSEEWDHYIEYGAKLGTYVAIDKLIIGIEVPYLVGRFKPEYDYTDEGDNQVTVSDERRNQGFGLVVTTGIRF